MILVIILSVLSGAILSWSLLEAHYQQKVAKAYKLGLSDGRHFFGPPEYPDNFISL